MSLAAAVWCVRCGAPPTVTITLERNGTLAHYGSCWDHVAEVAHRVRTDADRIDAGRAALDPEPLSNRAARARALDHYLDEHERRALPEYQPQRLADDTYDEHR